MAPSVKTLNDYIERAPKPGEMFSLIKPKAPAPVKAAIKYNDLLSFWGLDKQHSRIVQGDKVKWIYLKDNPYKVEALAFLDFDMPEKIRTFSSTMKNNSNIGRNLFYTVIDEVTEKYLGVICISSDFLDLTPRDKAIGWERTVKTQGNMINHTAIGSTIVPLQPLGFNYMGGKLLALLCLSDTVQKDWKRQYDDVLVGVTTTSLYGNTKSNGLSQYDGLEHWNKMGFSSGSVAFEPTKKTVNSVYDWVKENHTQKYFEWWEAKKPNGLPFKRDHKNRTLNFAYSKLGIPKNLIRTEHQRGIYFSYLSLVV